MTKCLGAGVRVLAWAEDGEVEWRGDEGGEEGEGKRGRESASAKAMADKEREGGTANRRDACSTRRSDTMADGTKGGGETGETRCSTGRTGGTPVLRGVGARWTTTERQT